MISLDFVDRAQAFRFMGHHGEPDAAFLSLADRCEQILLAAAVPRYTYRVCPVVTESGILSCGGIPFAGTDICRHLEGCSRAVLLCATLGAGADTAIRAAQAQDVLAGMMTDAMASALTEQLCDAAEEEILAQFPGIYATWRFSPGYGDFPLETQESFLCALNAQRRLGVTLSPGGLCIPTKTVTAVIGMSDTPVSKGKRGCAVCTQSKTCPYRAKGVHCS